MRVPGTHAQRARAAGTGEVYHDRYPPRTREAANDSPTGASPKRLEARVKPRKRGLTC